MPTQTFTNLTQEKRTLIINAALVEFASKPYEAASISDIVRKSGIAKGSLYQYFTDKKDLYQYLVKVSNERKLESVQSLPAPNPNADLFGYFHWLFQSTVYFEIQYPDHAQLIYRAYIEEVPFPDIKEELRRRGTTQFFKQLLTQGILHGEVTPFVDPDLAAFLLETVYYRFGHYFIDRLNIHRETADIATLFQGAEAQEMINNLLDIFKSGMQQK